MKKARITIETTFAQKKLFDDALQSCGLSLPEWFEAELQEFALPVAGRSSDRGHELRHLGELEDSRNVLNALAAIDWSFTEDDTAYLTHDIHPYPAKFIPQIPRNLIRHLSMRGELVYDPFGGSGTTALEAVLSGRRAVSTDVHPLAKIIGEAKVQTLTKEEDKEIGCLIDELTSLLDSGGLKERVSAPALVEMIPPIPKIDSWFHENAIKELAFLRREIERAGSEKVKGLAAAAFSKSVLKASYQDEETRYASKPRKVEIGYVVRVFVANLKALLKKTRALGALVRFRTALFETADARFLTECSSLRQDSVDLIVTSPPYPNTTDYHLYHRFRLFWLGYNPRDLAHKEIGSHLRHQKESTGFSDYLSEMKQCMENLFKVLRPGRFAVLVLGDGVFGGKVYNTAGRVAEASREIGFEHVGEVARQVHSTKRSFLAAGRRLRSEMLLVLRKPSVSMSLTLTGPPYKLWPYERDLQVREIRALTSKTELVPGRNAWRITVNPLEIDKLRRLTFVHNFQSHSYHHELTWQAVLENGDAFVEAKKKDPKYVTHGIHAYKGKFYPQLAKSLFNLASLSAGQQVLDPFCGSGTVLLEGYLNGLKSFGTDVNVLAVKIAQVKTQVLEVDAVLRDQMLAGFQENLAGVKPKLDSFSDTPIDIRSELHSWFPKKVLHKLASAMDLIESVPNPSVRELLRVLVSSLVREISHQEPRDLRIRRRDKPLDDAPVFELLRDRVIGIRRRLQHFAERSTFSPYRFQPAQAIVGDCRSLKSFAQCGLGPNPVDAIVTSPPYATALPYIDTDRLSILLLFSMGSKDRSVLEASLIGNREIRKKQRGEIDKLIDDDDFREIPSDVARKIIKEIRQRNARSSGGFRKQNTAALLYIYFRDMTKVLRCSLELMKPSASAFFVIGDNRTEAGGKPLVIGSARILEENASNIGLSIAESIPITVTTENRLHSKNSITENKILWLQKRPL